jgi:LDH2 family malate/lactate/ureidoglycolate dehydrogenase
MAALAAAVASDPAVRLPGSRRLVLRDQAAREGIRIDAALHAEIVTLSGKAG